MTTTGNININIYDTISNHLFLEIPKNSIHYLSSRQNGVRFFGAFSRVIFTALIQVYGSLRHVSSTDTNRRQKSCIFKITKQCFKMFFRVSFCRQFTLIFVVNFSCKILCIRSVEIPTVSIIYQNFTRWSSTTIQWIWSAISVVIT